MKDDAITLLRSLDPAGEPDVAGSGADRSALLSRAATLGASDASLEGERAVRPRARTARRLALASAAGAVAVVAVIALLPGASRDQAEPPPFQFPSPGGDPAEPSFESSSGALLAAAEAADRSGEPGGGPYPYVELLEQEAEFPASPDESYAADYLTKSEYWFRPDGTTHAVFSTSGPVLASPKDQALWEEAGSPTIGAPPAASERDFGVHSSPGAADDLGFYGLEPAGRPLPRDPAALADVFDSVTMDSVSAAAGDDSLTGRRVKYFDFGSRLLLEKAVDVRLRAAAYRLIAGLPGLTYDGRVTDPVGRVGTSVSFEGRLTDDFGKGDLTRYSLIFDADTSEPLAYVEENLEQRDAAGKPLTDYRVLVDSGKVGEIGERP